MNCPLDYSLCDQTVTLYRCKNDSIERIVLSGVHYQWQLQQTYDALGQQADTAFLLILPGEADIQVGDRVIRGEGPEIDLQAWPEFVQENVDGLCHVQFVQLYRFGLLSHTEAGRKASTFLY